MAEEIPVSEEQKRLLADIKSHRAAGMMEPGKPGVEDEVPKSKGQEELEADIAVHKAAGMMPPSEK